MKKIVSILLVLVMCCSMAACGDQVYRTDAKSEGFYEEQEAGSYEATYEQVEINFWHSLLGNMGQELADQYMAEHPNVKINVTNISWLDYQSKLTPALAAGTTPDIFECDLGVASDYGTRGLVANLQNALVARGYDESLYVEGAVDVCKYNGDLYTLPLFIETRVFYWNKDNFAAAGLDPDTAPETWEQVLEYAEKLAVYDENGDLIQYGFHPQAGFITEDYWPMALGGAVMSEDGETPLLTSDEVKSAFEYAYKIQEVQGGREAWEKFGDYTNTVEGDTFYGGLNSMMVSVHLAKGMIDSGMNWGCAPLPYFEGEERVTLSKGSALAFTDYGDADRLNAALDFGLWLCEYEQQYRIGRYDLESDLNDMCAAYEQACVDSMQTYEEVYPQEYIDAIVEGMRTSVFSTPSVAYPDYDTAYSTAFSYYLTDKKTLEDALNDAQELIESEIANYHTMNEN